MTHGDGKRSEQPSRMALGRRAERVVAAFLQDRGFAIVATNLRIGALELDVVARSGALVVVVEVRTRGSGAWTTGLSSIGVEKRRRIRRAGERLWQRRYQRDPSVERLRFDAAAVRFRANEAPEVEYIPAAF